MGVVVLYPHSVLYLPSFSALYGSRPKFGNPIFSFNETANYRPFVSSIRADGNPRERPPKNTSSKGEKGGNDSGKSSASSSKEEILALFKRIQSSISKGDTINFKKRSLKANEEKKPSAESLLEVLRQSRTRGKGKTLGKKEDKLVAPYNDSQKKKEGREHSSIIDLKATRPPSIFSKRSPITPLSTPRVQLKSEALPVIDDDKYEQSKKFEDMKLPELKEIAKSKGLKGYSKLKKSELVKLLISS